MSLGKQELSGDSYSLHAESHPLLRQSEREGRLGKNCEREKWYPGCPDSADVLGTSVSPRVSELELAASGGLLRERGRGKGEVGENI